MMKDSTKELHPPSQRHQRACMTTRLGIEIEAEAQEADQSPSQDAMSLSYASSRQDANHQGDVPSPQLVSGQEDVQNLVNQQVDEPSLRQDAINQEAGTKALVSQATRKWSTSVRVVVGVLSEVQVLQLDRLLHRLGTSQCHPQSQPWQVADPRSGRECESEV